MVELIVGYGVGSFLGILGANLAVYFVTKHWAERKLSKNKKAVSDLLKRYEQELSDQDK